MLRRTTLTLLFAVLSSTSALSENQDAGFTPLFNGKDFTGWVNVNGADNTWSIQSDGTIACTGFPIAALRSMKQYENFILEAEWRHMKSAGNAGIFIWAGPLPAVGQPFLRAIEVQVLDHGYGNTDRYTTHGDVFAIHGSTMEPFGPSRGMRSFPTEHRSKPSPEWNHYRVTCVDGVIKLAVNGKEVSGGANANWRKGYIGLESEGSPTEWRNVRIKELPGSSAQSEQTAPLARKSTALYDGLTLKKWDAENPSAWETVDWKIKASGDNTKLSPHLQLQEDGEFFIDCASQTKEEGSLKVILTDENGESLSFDTPLRKDWHRFILRKKGNKITLHTQEPKSEDIKDLGIAASFRANQPEKVKVTLSCDKPALLCNPFWVE